MIARWAFCSPLVVYTYLCNEIGVIILMRDVLGQRGEAIFMVLMTTFHSNYRPIFKPQFLGDKWQSVDFIVELVGAGNIVPYFFVQVK